MKICSFIKCTLPVAIINLAFVACGTKTEVRTEKVKDPTLIQQLKDAQTLLQKKDAEAKKSEAEAKQRDADSKKREEDLKKANDILSGIKTGRDVSKPWLEKSLKEITGLKTDAESRLASLSKDKVEVEKDIKKVEDLKASADKKQVAKDVAEKNVEKATAESKAATDSAIQAQKTLEAAVALHTNLRTDYNDGRPSTDVCEKYGLNLSERQCVEGLAKKTDEAKKTRDDSKAAHDSAVEAQTKAEANLKALVEAATSASSDFTNASTDFNAADKVKFEADKAKLAELNKGIEAEEAAIKEYNAGMDALNSYLSLK